MLLLAAPPASSAVSYGYLVMCDFEDTNRTHAMLWPPPALPRAPGACVCVCVCGAAAVVAPGPGGSGSLGGGGWVGGRGWVWGRGWGAGEGSRARMHSYICSADAFALADSHARNAHGRVSFPYRCPKHAHTHTHTHALTLTLTHSLTHTHTHTYTHTRNVFLVLFNTHTHAHARTLSRRHYAGAVDAALHGSAAAAARQSGAGAGADGLGGGAGSLGAVAGATGSEGGRRAGAGGGGRGLCPLLPTRKPETRGGGSRAAVAQGSRDDARRRWGLGARGWGLHPMGCIGEHSTPHATPPSCGYRPPTSTDRPRASHASYTHTPRHARNTPSAHDQLRIPFLSCRSQHRACRCGATPAPPAASRRARRSAWTASRSMPSWCWWRRARGRRAPRPCGSQARTGCWGTPRTRRRDPTACCCTSWTGACPTRVSAAWMCVVGWWVGGGDNGRGEQERGMGEGWFSRWRWWLDEAWGGSRA